MIFNLSLSKMTSFPKTTKTKSSQAYLVSEMTDI